jgi:branched-chain amino acid transport system permease protein
MHPRSFTDWLSAAFCLFVVIAPFLGDAELANRLYNINVQILLYAILALGLNIVVGWVGLLDLGYVAFVLIGVYTSVAICNSGPMLFDDGTPLPFVFLVAAVAAMVHAGLWGIVRGIPSLRLRDDYFAILTFAFAEIVFTAVKNEVWLTGGPKGYENAAPPSIGFLSAWKPGSLPYYYLLLIVVALVTVSMVRLHRSRVGRAWLAIKADETSAQTSGIAINRFKMLAFTISAVIGGLGGALAGWNYYNISPNTFDFWMSVIVLCCLVLGGMGSIRGVLIGTAALVGLGEVLRDLLPALGIDARARFVFYGLVMLGIMVFRAKGIHPPALRNEGFTSDDAFNRVVQPARLFTLDVSRLHSQPHRAIVEVDEDRTPEAHDSDRLTTSERAANDALDRKSKGDV